MKERPILFSAPMVRAILDGKKTQTRRIVKPQPADHEWIEQNGDGSFSWCLMGKPECGTGVWEQNEERYPHKCPYGLVSHSLWVRETWRCFGGREYEYQQEKSSIIYRCDVNPSDDVAEWRPSIFMPRWASRINLLIKSIRVERLNDISEAGAQAEGVEPFFSTHPSIGRDQTMTTGERISDCEHRASFACLWDDIHGDNSWQQNPWVWVVEFEVMK